MHDAREIETRAASGGFDAIVLDVVPPGAGLVPTVHGMGFTPGTWCADASHTG